MAPNLVICTSAMTLNWHQVRSPAPYRLKLCGSRCGRVPPAVSPFMRSIIQSEERDVKEVKAFLERHGFVDMYSERSSSGYKVVRMEPVMASEVAKELGSVRIQNILSRMGAPKPRSGSALSSLLSWVRGKQEEETSKLDLPLRSSLSRSTCSRSSDDSIVTVLISEYL